MAFFVESLTASLDRIGMADTITYILAFCFAMLMPLIYFQRYRRQRSRAQDEMAAAQFHDANFPP